MIVRGFKRRAEKVSKDGGTGRRTKRGYQEDGGELTFTLLLSWG
jgi:hypothetical protein